MSAPLNQGGAFSFTAHSTGSIPHHSSFQDLFRNLKIIGYIFRGAIVGKTGKTAVLSGFCKIESRGSSSGGASLHIVGAREIGVLPV